MPHRPPLNLKRPLVAASDFLFAGEQFKKGDSFPVKDFSPRLIHRQYEARKIVHVGDEPVADEAAEAVETHGVTMASTDKKNTFLVSAPWLAEPETIRGQKNAEKRRDALIAEGPPAKDTKEPNADPEWLAGVQYGTTEDGKHTASAPWLEEPDVFETADEASARVAQLREDGPPEGWEPKQAENEGGEGGPANAAASE